ncbi:MAG TPA: 4Fe-4S single cluster domain-containing protein [Candidatus Wallbacteria bacterium]|nr:4Fe-4S single cluster domain-containing protein [Candidatus Wallbacteria bacterium]
MKPSLSKTFIYVNLIYYPINVLGPGERVGLWTQGCTIRCPGCVASYTWEFSGEYKMKVKEAADKILSFGSGRLTVSGGEPFDQPAAFNELLILLRKGGIEDIMVYSGYPYDILRKNHSFTLDKIDALVDSPFVEGAYSNEKWRGSNNQNMIILSEKKQLREKYMSYMADAVAGAGRALQVASCGGKIYVIGIPDQRDVSGIKSGLGSI